MARNNVNVKAVLTSYLKDEANYDGEYVKAASAALKREGFERIVLFDHKDQLVMINMNASMKNIESGIVLNEEGKIEKFQMSDDRKSVTTNALTRCLIMESIDNETDILRLRTLSKDKHSWVIHYHTNAQNEEDNVPHEEWFPPYMCNVHTHGLAAFAHRDFQVVLDIGSQSTAYLLNKLSEKAITLTVMIK